MRKINRGKIIFFVCFYTHSSLVAFASILIGTQNYLKKYFRKSALKAKTKLLKIEHNRIIETGKDGGSKRSKSALLK